jgi:DNA primase
VVGFGGRVLDDSLPKYLNSPETALFSKSREVYGLNELLEKQARPDFILVVEGYMDVIALAQNGIHNVVATLGTATSKAHLDLLFRLSSELVFCFDGDQAGLQAAWKATEVALSCLRDGRQIKIILLPAGHDPDSLVRKEGLEGFSAQVQSAWVLSDYFFHQIANRLNLATVEGRSQFLAAARPQLEKIPKGFFRDMMFDRLRQVSGAPLSATTDNTSTIVIGDQNKPKPPRQAAKSNLMRTLLSLLLRHPQLAKRIDSRQLMQLERLDIAGMPLLKDVLEAIALKKPENSAVLLEYFRDTPHQKAVYALANWALDRPEGGEEEELSGALQQLERRAQESRMQGLIAKVSRGERLSPEEIEDYKSGGNPNPR